MMAMTFGNLPRKPNLLLIVTDQEREVMHWPDGWAEANLPARNPLEMNNLAHATHRTAASDVERARLHQRLTDVMREKGTTPDEISWPGEGDYRTA